MNTEKLTLEMLAPYLPYGLKMANGKYIGEIESVMIDKGEFRISCSGWYEKFSDGKYLPILRPMSDLWTPIDGFDLANHLYRKYDIIEDMEFDGGITDPKYGYEVYLELIKHLFDVFGLIEKGLAIDINTLEKISPAI